MLSETYLRVLSNGGAGRKPGSKAVRSVETRSAPARSVPAVDEPVLVAAGGPPQETDKGTAPGTIGVEGRG